MARGWESKSVEQQQEEKLEPSQRGSAPLSPEQQKRNRKRDGLLLSRENLIQQLLTAGNQRRRHMLEQAIAALDNQISSLQPVDSTPK
ncbi:MAG: hypothetical protein ACLPHI_00915 [Terriglobales bacterium]